MSLESDFREQIRKQYATLTMSQKNIAKFVLDKPNLVALHPAKKIGEMTNTSETTVIRFCYALGYSGYSSLQMDIKKSLLTSNHQEGPVQKYHNSTINRMNKENFIEYTLKTQIDAIQQVLYELDKEIYQKAIEMIIHAEKVMVAGFMSANIPARWLSSILNTIKGNTYLYTGAMDDANYFFTEKETEWLVILISFSRHRKETLTFMKEAKLIGAKIIAITDGELSPIASEADLMIRVNAPKPEYVKGITTIFSVMEILINGVMMMDAENAQKRLKDFDKLSSRFYPFIED